MKPVNERGLGSKKEKRGEKIETGVYGRGKTITENEKIALIGK